MKVAAVQFASLPDPVANRARASELVRQAAGEGAELVVLPEAAMYAYDRPPEEIAGVAETLQGAFVGCLAGLTSKLGVTAIAGMFEKVPDEERVYNTVVAVGPSGLLGRYRKLHLFDALGKRESDTVAPGSIDGSELLTFELGGFVVGPVICYDLRFPELFRALVEKGATVITASAAWVAGPQKREQWVTMCRARAMENTCYVVAAAQPPPDYCGHSLVIDPMGVELARLSEPDGLACAEISEERLDEVRELLPMLAQRRYEVRPRP